MDLRHLRSVQGRLLGFSVQLDPIGGKRETPAVWKDLQPCSGGKSPTLRRARSKQHLISNGLVKWNTQREETDLWEVSNLRSARSLDNKHSAVTRERVG